MPKNKSVDIADFIQIKHSKRARRLALRLDPKERVVNLVIPRGVSLRNAEAFARHHENWIEKCLMDLPHPVPFEDGNIVPVFGIKRLITIDYNPDYNTTDIKLLRNEIRIVTNKEDPTPRLIRFLKSIAKEKLTEMSLEKAALVRRRVYGVSIKDTKSRWGSCSEDGKLAFSWRLIFAPPKAMDYVVAHEVAHLVHLNHGASFWRLCRDLSDDFMDGEYWMRNHGHELMSYGHSDNI